MIEWRDYSNQLFYQEIIFAKRWTFEHVMKLNCSRVNCIIERLYSSCYWFSNIFSLHDLFETCSLICNYRTRTFIASRYWHDCFRVSCSLKKLYLRNAFSIERAMILICSRIDCIVRKIVLSCCWLSNTFLLYGLFETWSFIFDYRTSIAP